MTSTGKAVWAAATASVVTMMVMLPLLTQPASASSCGRVERENYYLRSALNFYGSTTEEIDQWLTKRLDESLDKR